MLLTTCVSVSLLLLSVFATLYSCLALPLRFGPDGQFKILQIADMHYANGAHTRCKDVLHWQYRDCSDLNTTAFVRTLIATEKPDLIVFTGDNIFGQDTKDPIGSLNAAFAPAIEARVPWAAILGNHDQESSLSRHEVMEHIVGMDYTLSQVYPNKQNHSHEGQTSTFIDGYGNYHLELKGAAGSAFEAKSLLHLFMIDSGDYSKDSRVHGYGWIQESQKEWFKQSVLRLQAEQQIDQASPPELHTLVYFHIPLVETRRASMCSIVGVKQEGIGCARVNSGFLRTMLDVGSVRAVFNGHDHVNDFCGNLGEGVKVCYGGGAGYHAYGKAGWARRARVVLVSLAAAKRMDNSSSAPTDEVTGGVKAILTWKRLDDSKLSVMDHEILWSAAPKKENQAWLSSSFLVGLFVCLYVLWILLAYSMSWWPFKRKDGDMKYTALAGRGV